MWMALTIIVVWSISSLYFFSDSIYDTVLSKRDSMGFGVQETDFDCSGRRGEILCMGYREMAYESMFKRARWFVDYWMVSQDVRLLYLTDASDTHNYTHTHTHTQFDTGTTSVRNQ